MGGRQLIICLLTMLLLVFANSVRPDGFTDRISPGVFNSLTVFFPDVFTDNVLLSVFIMTMFLLVCLCQCSTRCV